MTISIVVPSLNEEKLLGSMLQQFTPALVAKHHLEIVVSDGGSTDRTLEIARRYANTVVENAAGAKQTISIGRNCGARAAKGEVLVFLNADTRIRDVGYFFSRLEEEIDAPGLAALTSSVEVYPEEQTTIDRFYHGFYNWYFHALNRIGEGMGRGECHIMKREVYDKVGGYADHIVAGEDYDMFRRLARIGRVKFLRDVVVYESPRRYRRYGYLYVTAAWFVNSVALLLLRRSILSEWKPIR